MKTFDEIRGNSLTEATAGDHEEAAMAHDMAAKSARQDLRAKKAHQRAAEHHSAAAAHIENGNHEKANASHAKAKDAAGTAKQYGNKHSANAHADTHAVKRVRSVVGEGHPDNKPKGKLPEDTSAAVNELDTSTLVSYRKKANKQRYSNNISKRTQRTAGVDRADKKLRKRNIDKFGDHSPKGVDRMGNRKEDTSDAVKAFLAKGGKIKKLAPAKAQGYHGKDDPGKGMHGMMDKPDTKAMGTRKKVKSMEATQVDEISKDTKKSYIKKAADDMSKQADRMARAQRGDGKMDKAVNKFVNRRKGIARAVESVDEAKRTVTIDKPDRLASLRISKDTSPPFDNARKISTTPTKDQFGNVIKNRAKSLARAAAKKAGGDMGDKQKKESLWDNIRKRRAAGKPRKKPGQKGYPKTLDIENTVNELDQKTMNSYHDKAQKSKDKATNSAVATILRKGDHSKDLKTMSKREKGMKLAKSRTIKKIRGDK